MSWVTILWSMIGATSLTLGVVHWLIWIQNRERRDRLFFSFLAVGTAGMAWGELCMMKAATAADFASALRWYHVPVWLNVIAVVGFVRCYLNAGRRWLGGLAIGLRSLALGINFLVWPAINYREIVGIRLISWFGDQVTMVLGRPNPWMLVAQAALVVLLIFVIDAAHSVWQRGERRRSLLIGGSMVFFILMGTIQSVLSFWQWFDVPAGGSLYFLGMIAAAAFDLSLETQRAAKLENELRASQESKRNELAHLGRVVTFGEFSVSLAHEMNQPLAIILSNAQAAQRLLAKDPPNLDEVRDILGDIVAEDLRASKMIERIRALLRKGEAVREKLHLNELAEETFKLLQSELNRRQITLIPEFAEDLHFVSADRIQLQQVLVNLILNACEAMENSPSGNRTIRVATSNGGSMVHLFVRDTGPGLPPDREIAFEPYFTTKNQGLGMGLAICRSIVNSHHGELLADSNQPCGATFHLKLPAISESQ